MIFNCFCHQAEKGSLTLDLCDLKLPGTVLLEECLLYVSFFIDPFYIIQLRLEFSSLVEVRSSTEFFSLALYVR